MTKAQLLAALPTQVRQLLKAGYPVSGFAAIGDDPLPYAELAIRSPGGPRTIRLGVANLTLAGLPAALQHEVIQALRPWETAHRNGFDTTGACQRGLAVDA